MALKEIIDGVCKTCKGKRSVTVKGKKQKCKPCKGTGIILDKIY